MFETIFSYPAVQRRHSEGPLAAERASYLEGLALAGASHFTLQQRATTCLQIAWKLKRWPDDYLFSDADIETFSESWAEQIVQTGRAVAVKWPKRRLQFAIKEFLTVLGRLKSEPEPPQGRYDDKIANFINAQHQRQWKSIATCDSGRWQVQKFLSYLENQGYFLDCIDANHIDAYFKHIALKWSRYSVCTAAKALRAWFRYCEEKGWTKPGLASTIFQPRIYRLEGLPLGPTWEQVTKIIASLDGDEPAFLRDRAILLLLSVYGLRSGEVRRLQLNDLDWQEKQIRILRSKSYRQDIFPLEPQVGSAIVCYLRDGRPSSTNRTLFLTLRAPFRPLSAGGIWHIVNRHFCPNASGSGKHSPRGLRHACARHLVASGFSFKEIGDHLGHSSPDSTRVYAKVDLNSLRLVALEDFEGLS